MAAPVFAQDCAAGINVTPKKRYDLLARYYQNAGNPQLPSSSVLGVGRYYSVSKKNKPNAFLVFTKGSPEDHGDFPGHEENEGNIAYDIASMIDEVPTEFDHIHSWNDINSTRRQRMQEVAAEYSSLDRDSTSWVAHWRNVSKIFVRECYLDGDHIFLVRWSHKGTTTGYGFYRNRLEQ